VNLLAIVWGRGCFVSLPESISALRVLDVIAWRDAKDAGL
jgi:hypothetical protein